MNASMKTTIITLQSCCQLGVPPKSMRMVLSEEETVLNSTTGEVNMQHKEGYITTDTTGMQRWYDIFSDMGNQKVVLIHGTDAQAVSWMPHFYQSLVNAGYCVIRFDQRGNGLSENFGKLKGFNMILTGLKDDPMGPLHPD